ncbi:adenylate/guanylate cyclase domain-containing protein [Pseudahrensia aquimaris]|uniref:Adenylate/guanylate cyclase domain-containing protein n=1 Tax=Pseudahrensia aquimaris TaxID=744461 RepID=A0ABW3FEN9_9HYPH
MSRDTLINEIGEWLIDQTLTEPDIVVMFEQVCFRLRSVGVPISRARVTWPTLHPLFQAETILWRLDGDIEFEQFRHQDDASEEWKRSPMAMMLKNNITEFRRNLTGPNKLLDFPILDDLAEQGFTDYLIIATSFEGNTGAELHAQSRGLIVTWSSDRESGFSDDDLAALKKIQRRFAAACKMAIRMRIAKSVTETYLGRYAGSRVLDGAIKLGDGETVQAVVWYSDMRDSTKLADTMPAADLLALLNEYFECTAGAATRFGGEVLDFIGDAVLAIFPFENEEGRKQAIRMSTMALEESQAMIEDVNARRRANGDMPILFGVGINVGEVLYGNIGVADRLAFTVIGPVVNEVERIESLTKSLQAAALVSEEVAAQDPEKWTSIGMQSLSGFARDCELFALKSQVESKSGSVTAQKAQLKVVTP